MYSTADGTPILFDDNLPLLLANLLIVFGLSFVLFDFNASQPGLHFDSYNLREQVCMDAYVHIWTGAYTCLCMCV